MRDVAPERVNRVVCHCWACQRYPEILGCEDLVLDADGGTDVVNVSPAMIEFAQGIEHVACLKITRKGPLRWYAACCDTPLCNTFGGPSWPFVGLLHHACVPNSEDHIGPIRARVNGTFPRGEARAKKATVGALLSMLWHYAPLFFGWKLRGDHRRSPFFTGKTPLREPRELEAPRPRRALAAGCD